MYIEYAFSMVGGSVTCIILNVSLKLRLPLDVDRGNKWLNHNFYKGVQMTTKEGGPAPVMFQCFPI